MAQNPKLRNPFINWQKSSRDYKLWNRVEKRSFFDFGHPVFYIVPEILDEDRFYGEQKLLFKDYFETTLKMQQDPITDEMLEYQRLGLRWGDDARIVFDMHKELFDEHVTQPLEKRFDGKKEKILRPEPRPQDLIYFNPDSNDDENDSGTKFHYIWLFEITDVIFDRDSAPHAFSKNINYKISAKQFQINQFNEFSKETKEDLGIEEEVVPPIEEHFENRADNEIVDYDEDIEIFRRQKDTDV